MTDDAFDPSTARTKLEFIQKNVLNDVRQVVDKLEHVAGQVGATAERIQEVRTATKQEMHGVAAQLVKAAHILQAERASTTAVTLSPNGRAIVRELVDHALKAGTPDLVEAISKATPPALNAMEVNINAMKSNIEDLAKMQRALLLRLKGQDGINWTLLGAFAAACLVSAVIGGSVVAWAFKPASTGRQDLTLESGAPAARSGQKIDAAKQEQH